MGYDDGECEESPTRIHDFVLTDVVPGGRGGLAQVDQCSACGATAYTPSAGDQPNRPPL